MNNQSYGVYSKFDVERHKTNFVDYLEVVIDETGQIMYAVPSHQEKAISLACQKLDITRDELNDLCPVEYYFDFANWLCKIANIVLVWNDFCIADKPNDKQIEALKLLKTEGVYKGVIPGEARSELAK